MLRTSVAEQGALALETVTRTSEVRRDLDVGLSSWTWLDSLGIRRVDGDAVR